MSGAGGNGTPQVSPQEYELAGKVGDKEGMEAGGGPGAIHFISLHWEEAGGGGGRGGKEWRGVPLQEEQRLIAVWERAAVDEHRGERSIGAARRAVLEWSEAVPGWGLFALQEGTRRPVCFGVCVRQGPGNPARFAEAMQQLLGCVHPVWGMGLPHVVPYP